MSVPKIRFTLYKNGKRHRMWQTDNSKRIWQILGTGKWQLRPFFGTIRVDYKKGFVNEGEYNKIADLKKALRAFLET